MYQRINVTVLEQVLNGNSTIKTNRQLDEGYPSLIFLIMSSLVV